MAVRAFQPVRWTPAERAATRPEARTGPGPQGAIVFGFDVFALVLCLVVFGHTGWVGLVDIGLALCALTVRGHHRPRLVPSLSKDAGAIAGTLAIPLLGSLLLAEQTTHTNLLPWGMAAIAAAVVGRGVSYATLRTLRAHGQIIEPTVIIGAGNVGVELAQVLREHPEYGLVPVGFLDSFDDVDLPLPILGDVSSLEQIVPEYEVRRVIVAFGSMREPDMVPILRACDRGQVDIHVLPRFFEMGVAPAAGDTDDLWGMPIIQLRRFALRTVAWRTKRAFDLVVAGAVLTVLSPLLALVAVGVKLSSPGPVFFRQQRIGQNGRVVDILKFRSMRVNGDSDTKWSVIGDDRTTWFGRVIRKTSLDELPQLINVLRGDMSLVGPRPERPFFVNRFMTEVPGYEDRHRVPVGMTGWAQVHGLRGDTSIDERARFDNQYIENWSLWRDIMILVRTVVEVLRGTPT